MLQFECPSCGRMISANVPAGSPVQCPLCKQTVTVPEGASQPATPPVTPGAMPQAVTYGAPAAQPSQGLATTSLVSGLVGLLMCLPVAIVGLVTGIIALIRTSQDPQRYRGRGMAIAGIVLSGSAMVIQPMLIAILLPALSRARELSKRTVCAANIRMIGAGMYAYAQTDPNGAFPDDINKLLNAGFVSGAHFECPSMPPGHKCYFYVPGRTEHSGPNEVLMYEDPNNHMGEGGNVLYQDGHVAFEAMSVLQGIVDQHKDVAQ